MSQTTWEAAWSLLQKPDALEVPAASFKEIRILADKSFVDGKTTIGSAGFTACYAVVIKVRQNIGLGHIMVWEEGDSMETMVKHWGELARGYVGRAWIWVPYEKGVVQQKNILDGIKGALQLPEGSITEVRRDRVATDGTEPKLTAMAVSQKEIVMGTCHELFK